MKITVNHQSSLLFKVETQANGSVSSYTVDGNTANQGQWLRGASMSVDGDGFTFAVKGIDPDDQEFIVINGNGDDIDGDGTLELRDPLDFASIADQGGVFWRVG